MGRLMSTFVDGMPARRISPAGLWGALNGFNRLARCSMVVMVVAENPRCARGDAMAVSENKMADTDEKIFVGKGEQPAWLTLALANRHGLVTGATGTGKTVSLQEIGRAHV